MEKERKSTRRILIVEDNDFLAVDLELTLSGHGYASLVAPNVRMALFHIAEHELDGALLDVSLFGGESVFDVADALAAAQIPFLFLTGRSRRYLPERFRSVPLLTKPYDLLRLLAVMEASFRARKGGLDALDE